MNNNVNYNRILYPDIIRIVATFAVIMIHISNSYLQTNVIQSFNQHIANVYESLFRWAVPLFVMISGIFFLNPQKEITLKKLFRVNILRIVMALFFWGILYRTTRVFSSNFFENAKDLSTIALRMLHEYSDIIFGTAWYHLWFLYMIIGLYILVPLFRIFTKNAQKEHYHYLFFIFFIFGSSLSLWNNFMSLNEFGMSISFKIPELLGYSTYFILGYYLSVYKISQRNKRYIYVGAIISFLFQTIGTEYLSCKFHTIPHSFLYTNLRPNIFILSIAIFIFVKDFSKKILNERMKLITFTLSKYSFGIYLVHEFFTIGLHKIVHFLSDYCSLFVIPFLSLLTFILSFMVIWLMNKIPFINKYCI